MRVGPALALLLLVGGCGDPPPPPQDAKPSIEAIAAIDKVAPGGAHQIGAAEANGLWLYYPTQGQAKGTEPARPRAYVDALARRFGLVAAASLNASPLHARWDAEPAKGPHPLVLFAPGAGMGGRDYRLLVEALASRGYVVAMLDPLGSPPVTTERYAQIADALAAAVATLRSDSKWSSRLDFSRTVFAGHSIGGASAVLALSRLPEARGAINLDGDYSGASHAPAPAKPILYLTGATEGETAASIARRAGEWQVVRRSNSAAIRLEFPGMRHFDFADAAYLPAATIPDNRRQNRFGTLGRDVIRPLVIGFLDQVVGGKPGALQHAIDALPAQR